MYIITGDTLQITTTVRIKTATNVTHYESDMLNNFILVQLSKHESCGVSKLANNFIVWLNQQFMAS